MYCKWVFNVISFAWMDEKNATTKCQLHIKSNTITDGQKHAELHHEILCFWAFLQSSMLRFSLSLVCLLFLTTAESVLMIELLWWRRCVCTEARTDKGGGGRGVQIADRDQMVPKSPTNQPEQQYYSRLKCVPWQPWSGHVLKHRWQIKDSICASQCCNRSERFVISGEERRRWFSL